MTVDVVYELTDKQTAIWSVFSIDSDMHLLNAFIDDYGDLVLPTDWNDVWKVSTKAPESELFNTRFSVDDYKKLVKENIPGLVILAAGYSEDDVETMLTNREFSFTKFDLDDEGNSVEVEDVLLDEQGVNIDIRIAPTEATCDRYRELYPDHNTHTDEDGASITFARGNFSRHGK